jgi:hypothetical protein
MSTFNGSNVFWASELHISQAFWEYQTRQFQLCMSSWWSFVQNGYKVHFSCSLWGIPTCSHMAKIAQRLKGRVLRKKFVLPTKSWLFTSFTFFFCFFANDSIWCHLQCGRYNLNVNFFQEIVLGPQSWTFESRLLSTIRILAHL